MDDDRPHIGGTKADEAAIRRAIADQLLRNGIVRALSAARAFLVLPLISPAQLAIYRYATISLSYTSYLDCGAVNVMGVKYPERIGAGDVDGARRVADSCWHITFAGALIAVLVAFPLVWIEDLNPQLRILLVISAGMGLLFKVLTVWFRAQLKFSDIARIEVIATTLSFLITIGATVLWDLAGLIIGTVSLPLIGLILGREGFRGIKFRVQWTRYDGQTLKLGVRLWLTGFLFGLAGSGDIFVLTRLLEVSSAAIGPYALASMIAASLDALAAGTGQVLATWLSRIVGEAGSPRAPRALAALESSIAKDSFSAVILIGLTGMALALIVPHLLEEYLPALALFASLGLGVATRRWLRYPLHMISLVGTTKAANLVGGGVLTLTVLGMLLIAWTTNRSLDAIAGFVAIVNVLGSASILLVAYWVLEELRLGARVAAKLLIAHLPLSAMPLSMFLLSEQPLSDSARLFLGSALALAGCVLSFRITFPEAPASGWRAVIAPAIRILSAVRDRVAR